LGPITRIEIIGSKNPYDENRLLIQIKNYDNAIILDKIHIKDKLEVGDSITVYAKHNSEITKGQKISNVYGLYSKNVAIIDLKEASRVNKWIGIVLILVGHIIMFVALIYNRFSKKVKYKYVNIEVDNLPNY
jgi:hypothetical protein